MKFFRLLCLLPALAFLLATCGSPADVSSDPTGNVTTTLAGVVTDESGQPVSGVAVTSSGKNAVTDKYGTFMIQNVSVPAARCFILCKKDTYFTGSRAVIPKGGGTTELRLTLQRSLPFGYTVNSSTGGTLTIGTASVKFPPSAFVRSDGSPFTGTVYVAAKYLDPSQDLFYNSFSGDMTARRADGSQTELYSYGVLRVRLMDQSIAELKLAAGKTATLTYPIAATQQKTAPASMPLWYFDEALGMWKEEGVAVKSGDVYSGEVSHFTDWNCDVPAKTGIVKGRVACDSKGVAGVHMRVGQKKIITDQNGYFSTRVPSNVDCKISIALSENAGLTAPDVQVPALNDGETRTIADIVMCPGFVTGTIVDCNDVPVAGYVIVTSSRGKYYTFTSTGEFSAIVSTGLYLSIAATTYDGKVVADVIKNGLAANQTVHVGRMSACENINQTEYYDIPIESSIVDSAVPILSGDGSMLAVYGNSKGGQEKSVVVFDTKTGKKLSDWHKNTQIRRANFSDDGTILLISWTDGKVDIVNPRTGGMIKQLDNISNAYILPNGTGFIGFSYGDSSIKSSNYLFSLPDGVAIKKTPNDIIGIRGSDDYVLGGSTEVCGDGLRGGTPYSHANGTSVGIISFKKIMSDSIAAGYCTYQSRRIFSNDYSVIYYSINVQSSQYCPMGIFFNGYYNSITGARYNSYSLPTTIANDGTYLVEGSSVSPFQLPTTYSMVSGSILRILPVRTQTTVYSGYTYSSNSRYLAATQKDQSAYSVRVWKVK